MILFIDVETTGLSVEHSQLLQLAAVPVIEGKPDLARSFNQFIKHTHYYVEQGVAANPDLLRNVTASAREGRALGDVRLAFGRYLNYLREPGPKIVVGGKNVARFDIPVLREAEFDTEALFDHRTVDIGNLFLEPRDPRVPSLDECWKRALGRGWITDEWTVKHDALDDALATANLYAAWARFNGSQTLGGVCGSTLFKLNA